jgi:xanthine dehydrogenase molybdopterin-binding subunit B
VSALQVTTVKTLAIGAQTSSARTNPATTAGSAALDLARAAVTATALPDKKKLHAFRVSDAEGQATDFYIDPETGRILRYEFKYEGLTTSMEFERKSLKEVEGVLVSY